MTEAIGDPRPVPVPDPVRRVAEWAATTFGGPVDLVGEIQTKGEGFDSTIHFLQLEGDLLPEEWRQPLVLRIKSDPDRLDEARAEAEVHNWLVTNGYPAPPVHKVFAPGELIDLPVQVLARAPGTLALEALVRQPWRARRTLRLLAAAHSRLHALPPAGFPAADDLLDRRLALVRRTADVLDHDQLRAGLRRVEAMADDLRAAEGVVCHGDFHPLNILLDGETVTVIDWTDAGVGDRAGDVARTLVLFEVASLAARSRIEKVALRAAGPVLRRVYRNAYRASAPLDERRVALWTPVHLLHGWSQAAGLHGGQFERSGGADDNRLERVPLQLVDILAHRFAAAMDAVAR